MRFQVAKPQLVAVLLGGFIVMPEYALADLIPSGRNSFAAKIASLTAMLPSSTNVSFASFNGNTTRLTCPG